MMHVGKCSTPSTHELAFSNSLASPELSQNKKSLQQQGTVEADFFVPREAIDEPKPQEAVIFSHVDEIPENGYVPGKLRIEGHDYMGRPRWSNWTSLPERLKRVEGHLTIIGCPNVTSLPEGLTVGEGLGLIDCPNLTSLPKGLRVRDSIVIRECPNLKHLPPDFSTQTCRDIELNQVLNKVSDYLTIGNSQLSLTYVPEHLRKKGFMKLIVNSSSLFDTPRQSLYLPYSLVLKECPSLTRLPLEELHVDGDLDLSESPNLTTLARKKMIVTGNLRLHSCPKLTTPPKKCMWEGSLTSLCARA